MMPRIPHSTIIAIQTPIMPKPKVIAKIYPGITRNNHIEIKEVSEVKFESPAARNADGKTKLNDHKNGCAMADTITIDKDSWNDFLRWMRTFSSASEKTAII